MLVVDPRILALLKPFGLVAADLERPNDPSSYPVLDFLCREVARIVTVVWHDDPDGGVQSRGVAARGVEARARPRASGARDRGEVTWAAFQKRYRRWKDTGADDSTAFEQASRGIEPMPT